MYNRGGGREDDDEEEKEVETERRKRTSVKSKEMLKSVCRWEMRQRLLCLSADS